MHPLSRYMHNRMKLGIVQMLRIWHYRRINCAQNGASEIKIIKENFRDAVTLMTAFKTTKKLVFFLVL